MTDLRQAAQQALEALAGELWLMLDKPEDEQYRVKYAYLLTVITALRTALEQKQAEPVCPNCKAAVLYECVACSSNNYPPQQQAEPVAQREWVGLTEFQFAEIYNKWNDTNGSTPWGLNQALEAKLKERNT